MNKTKKSGFLKIAGIMTAVTMLAVCVVSGTMAKYTSKSGDLSLSTSVASWSITVGEDDTKLESLAATAIKFTILDTDTSTSSSSYKEDHVTENMIAPGTWGYAELTIKNGGDVTAKISATLDKSSVTLPTGMKVTLLNSKPSEPPTISAETLTITADNVAAKTGTATIVIAFVWEFGSTGNDANDTPYGTGTSTLESLGTLTITADQVD